MALPQNCWDDSEKGRHMTEILTRMQAMPSETPLEDEALAAYEKKFREDNTIWAELLQENLDRLGRGSFSLHWMDTDKANWGARARPSSRV